MSAVAVTPITRPPEVTSFPSESFVPATADTLAQAVEKAYTASDRIYFQGLHRRNDIGAKALAAAE